MIWKSRSSADEKSRSEIASISLRRLMEQVVSRVQPNQPHTQTNPTGDATQHGPTP
jgi:hypothetical protein